MKLLLTMSPTIFFAVYGQMITRWRVDILSGKTQGLGGMSRLLVYLTDPYIASAYVAAFCGSLAWMFVVERYSVSLAFPIYIGLTVLLVVIGGATLFNEHLAASHVIATILIVAGVAIGTRA